MTDPDERAVDEIGRVYRYVLAALNTAGWADLDKVYDTVLSLPDGSLAAVGDWTAADVAAVRARVDAARADAGDTSTGTQQPNETTTRHTTNGAVT
jgi:hypothetical protein